MGIKVKTLHLGYYGDQLRQPGQEFEIKNKGEMGSWMAKVEPSKADVEAAKKVLAEQAAAEADAKAKTGKADTLA